MYDARKLAVTDDSSGRSFHSSILLILNTESVTVGHYVGLNHIVQLSVAVLAEA